MLKTYAQRVEDLLGEFRQHSKGNIDIQKLDPQPDSDAEDSAKLDGIDDTVEAVRTLRDARGPATDATAGSPRTLLRDPNFNAYFASFLLSNVGLFMQSLGVPILLFVLTKSSLWVGAGTFTAQVGALSMTPLSGILSDRVNRRLLLLASQTVQLGSATALWWFASSGWLTKWNMLVLLAVGGIGAGLQYSVAQAILPDLVAPAELPRGIRLMTLAFNVPRAFGPRTTSMRPRRRCDSRRATSSNIFDTPWPPKHDRSAMRKSAISSRGRNCSNRW